MDKILFSRRVGTGTRVYYIDVRKDSKQQPYVSISEIPTDKCPGRKRRQRVFIHCDNIEHLEALRKALGEVEDYLKCQ